MKVLIVHCGKGIYGGAELVIVELANYLYKQGHKITVVVKDVPKDFYGGIHPVIPCYQPETYLSLRSTVQDLLQEVDVVNVHNFPATLATFPKRVPTVYNCHEPAELFTSWWRKPIEAFNRWWVRRSGMRVVVADEFNAKRFKGIYGVEPTIIPYGVDYDFWSQPVDVEREGRFIILQVGHMEMMGESWKVLKEVQMDVPNAKLVVVGRANPSHYDDLEVTGFLDREKVREWYNKADVLLHPVGSQGGWLVPFEAICAGLPVIVSEEFTGAGMIRDNNLGLVRGTGDFADTVRHVHRNYELFQGYVRRKREEWVRENLTWDKFCEEIVKIFEEAIDVQKVQ